MLKKASKARTKQYNLNRLQKLEKSNTKEFWHEVRQIISKKCDTTIFSNTDYINYFKDLLNSEGYNNNNNNIDKQYVYYVEHSLPVLEICNPVGPLDFTISESEISSGIKAT